MSAFSHKQSFSFAGRGHRFQGHSPLSIAAGRIPMERRLAAILATDVVGYSRLIAADEEENLA